ncbi:hypothetical protein LEN26_009160 [Aphanomyces euteiches]|nr:hypothetical protein AeMF1_008728 [Aphanomyces euteiches]KAH9128075.1 hypothetical protein LEN26_009160 [Aphanomyces euteiches]KAH9185174.1 hypothetical protein AeNC1_012847 [Aphanomyces euteiches]
MDTSLVDALSTLPDEDILASTIDEMLMEEFGIFEPTTCSSSSTLASDLTVSKNPISPTDRSSKNPISPTDRSSKASPISTINLSRKRQRDEIEYLRCKVEELEQHLKVLQHVKASEDANETPWQRKANRVRKAKLAAMSENEKLKNELEGQIQFGKALQTLMTNRPQLTMLPTLQSDQWRVQKLVTDPVLRRQAIEEILHQQYQLTEFSMIESGFEDGEESLTSFTPRLARSTADLVMCAAYSKLFDFSVDIVSEFAWMMYQ